MSIFDKESEEAHIASLREKYAGREVSVKEEKSIWPEKPHRSIEQMEITEYVLDYDDPAIKEIFNDFGGMNSRSLRLMPPGTMQTMDYRWGRVTMYVQKEEDGKYRIQDNIKLG